jgi:hypothetical protein
METTWRKTAKFRLIAAIFATIDYVFSSKKVDFGSKCAQNWAQISATIRK